VLLSTLDTSGHYPSSTFKASLKYSNSNLNFGHVDTSPCFTLLSFLFFLQTDQGEGEGLLGISCWESRDLQILSFCCLQLGLEGGEKPEANDARPLPSPFVLRPAAALDPQSLIAVLLAPWNQPHPAEAPGQHPTPPSRTHAHREHPSRACTPPTVSRPVALPLTSRSTPCPIP
jgi:hypothetical protein